MTSIKKQISKYNHTTANRGKGSIKYIVLHWVGAVSSAKNNAAYFGGGNRNASAHYFVDASSVYQVVEDKNIAWHCGSGLQDQGSTLKKDGHKFYRIATNTNSIGIEMCLDRSGHIAEKTYENVAELVESLMEKYGVPLSNVIRHFDVTGKLCPGTLVQNDAWGKWKTKWLGGKPPTPKPPKPVTPAKPADKSPKPAPKGKSLDAVAKDVINGKYGTGDDRKRRLKAAGYDPAAVQARVNALLK